LKRSGRNDIFGKSDKENRDEGDLSKLFAEAIDFAIEIVNIEGTERYVITPVSAQYYRVLQSNIQF